MGPDIANDLPSPQPLTFHPDIDLPDH